MRSSLGFHTLGLFLRLSREEVQTLIEHFCAYRECTRLIRIRMCKFFFGGREEWSEYSPMYSGTSIILPLNLRISYQDKDYGIKWEIRSDSQKDTYKEYIVGVIINPKILGGIQDYITAATYNDIDAAINNFNSISKSISPVLGTFEQYTLKRVDYCINFSLNELAPGCSYEQVINLIKRSDIPPHFDLWTEYDPVSHRMKCKYGSFYLMNGSVCINCYSKYIELQDRRKKNGFDSVSPATMDAARDIIRFEIQCKRRKIYALSHRNNGNEITLPNQYQKLFTHKYCTDIIYNYYKKVIGMGDWYTLQEAIRMVKSHGFNSQRENRLIEALQLVNERRSVPKAKLACQGHDLMVFKGSLAELNSLRINPVTIPKEWGIKHIPNLLNEYFVFHRVSEEKLEKGIIDSWIEYMNDDLRYLY